MKNKIKKTCCRPISLFPPPALLDVESGDSELHDDSWGYIAPRGRSRYRQAAAAVAAAVATGGVGGGGSGVWGAGRRANEGGRHWELDACTFTPRVIGARKGMGQAQQYLQVSACLHMCGLRKYVEAGLLSMFFVFRPSSVFALPPP